MGRKTGLDAAEEQRNANSAETDATIKRVPPSDLGASLQDVGEFQWHNTKNGIVLPVARITDGYSDNSRFPVADETLGTCVENGLAANSLCTSAINLKPLAME